jgi:magnesium transporter
MAARLRAGTEALVESYCDLYPEEVAGELDLMPMEEVLAVLEHVPASGGAAVVERLNPDAAAAALRHMREAPFRTLVPAMDPQLSAAVLARWEPGVRERRLSLLPEGLAAELRDLGAFPPDTAGSLMDPRAMAFKRDTTVEEALRRIRAFPGRGVINVFLVDPENRLVGILSLQELAVAEPDVQLRTLVQTAPVFVETMTPKSDVVELLESRKLASLPVVDVNRRLAGVIRHAGLVEAVKEDASADMLSMVGASPQERALSNVSFAARKRFPWLLINLGTTFLAAAVVGLFEGTIARFTALAVLLPVVAGQSGNAGAQALAVVMRGLALREIRVRQGLRVALKESGVGLINGVLTGLVCSLGIYAWSGSPGLALVIGVALVLSMVAAGLSGAFIPVLLTALRQDPAQSSSIILTTVTDVIGFLSFLGLATLFASLLEAG